METAHLPEAADAPFSSSGTKDTPPACRCAELSNRCEELLKNIDDLNRLKQKDHDEITKLKIKHDGEMKLISSIRDKVQNDFDAIQRKYDQIAQSLYDLRQERDRQPQTEEEAPKLKKNRKRVRANDPDDRIDEIAEVSEDHIDEMIRKTELTPVVMEKDPHGRSRITSPPLDPEVQEKILVAQKEVGRDVPFYMFRSEEFGDRKDWARRIFPKNDKGQKIHGKSLALFYNKEKDVGFISRFHLRMFCRYMARVMEASAID
jgi:hypothetical protein